MGGLVFETSLAPSLEASEDEDDDDDDASASEDDDDGDANSSDINEMST